MRINDILVEDVSKNISFIREFTRLVIRELCPHIIHKDARITINLRSYTNAITKHFTSMDRLIAQRICEETVVILDNRANDMPYRMGEYVSERSNKYIIIYVASIIGEAKDFTKKELLAFRSDSSSVNSIENTFAHELRHAMQYYTNKATKDHHTYDTDPMERDASFYETLHEFDPADYDSAAKYIKDIMASMGRKKRLSDKDIVSYSRQAGKHYVDSKSVPQEVYMPTKVKYKEKKREELFNVKKALLAFANHDVYANDISDLRKVYGYDKNHGMFLLDTKLLFSFSHKILDKLMEDESPSTSVDNLNAILTFMSIINRISNKNEWHIFKKALIKYGASEEGAINDLSNKRIFGRYDTKFLKKCIQEFCK